MVQFINLFPHKEIQTGPFQCNPRKHKTWPQLFCIHSSDTRETSSPHWGLWALTKGHWRVIDREKQHNMQGIIVAPGVIDAHFEREIKVMTHSASGISVVKAGQRLAQLILLSANQISDQERKKEERMDLVHLMPIGYKS